MKKTFLATLCLMGLALAGCASTAAQQSGPPEVKVGLSEFKIEPSQTTFQTGKTYRFVVTNNGKINHEFMIMPPTKQGANMTMEEMDKMATAMIDADDLPPGTTKTVDVTFDKPTSQQSLEFACHVEGHYEAGMLVPITVQ